MIKEFMKFCGMVALMATIFVGVHSATWGENRAMAQEANQCMSTEQFIAKAKTTDAEQAAKIISLTGDTLNQFAANMDRLSGGGHSDMDAILLIDPNKSEGEITMLAIFNNHCFVGFAQVPTEMVKKALDGLSV